VLYARRRHGVVANIMVQSTIDDSDVLIIIMIIMVYDDMIYDGK